MIETLTCLSRPPNWENCGKLSFVRTQLNGVSKFRTAAVSLTFAINHGNLSHLTTLRASNENQSMQAVNINFIISSLNNLAGIYYKPCAMCHVKHYEPCASCIKIGIDLFLIFDVFLGQIRWTRY